MVRIFFSHCHHGYSKLFPTLWMFDKQIERSDSINKPHDTIPSGKKIRKQTDSEVAFSSRVVVFVDSSGTHSRAFCGEFLINSGYIHKSKERCRVSDVIASQLTQLYKDLEKKLRIN